MPKRGTCGVCANANKITANCCPRSRAAPPLGLLTHDPGSFLLWHQFCWFGWGDSMSTVVMLGRRTVHGISTLSLSLSFYLFISRFFDAAKCHCFTDSSGSECVSNFHFTGSLVLIRRAFYLQAIFPSFV